jgi:hypothetical protein
MLMVVSACDSDDPDHRAPVVARIGGHSVEVLATEIERFVATQDPLPDAVLVAVPEGVLDELPNPDDATIPLAELGYHCFYGWPHAGFAHGETWLIGTFVLSDPVSLGTVVSNEIVTDVCMEFWRRGIPYGTTIPGGNTGWEVWTCDAFYDQAVEALEARQPRTK